MNLLAIETCTDACSVGLLRTEQAADGQETDRQMLIEHHDAGQKQGELVLPMIDELMRQAGLVPAQIDGVAFGRGPGSFTGVRIGVAVTQGIALGADALVMGVSTLQTVAQGCHRVHGDTHVLVSVDARMGEVYTAAYVLDAEGIMQAVTEERVVPPADVSSLAELVRLSGSCLSDWSLAGSGATLYCGDRQDLRLREQCVPHAMDLLLLGEDQWRKGQALPAEQAMPVYLRDKVALTTAEREQAAKS